MNTDYYVWCTYLMLNGWTVTEVSRKSGGFYWWSDGGGGFLVDFNAVGELPDMPLELEQLAKKLIAQAEIK